MGREPLNLDNLNEGFPLDFEVVEHRGVSVSPDAVEIETVLAERGMI